MAKKKSNELTAKQSWDLYLHSQVVWKRLIKALGLPKDFTNHVENKKKYIFTKEELQVVKPICLKEKEYREKHNIPNSLWAFGTVEEFFMK